MATSPREYRRLMLGLLPEQGAVREDEYLWLTDRARRAIEFNEGSLEALPMPTRSHQLILKLLLRLFAAIVEPEGGIVLFAPLRLRLRAGKFREPDLLLLRDARDPRNGERFWTGADLVVEIVSADDPARDLVIPEYWIVDPRDRSVTVLTLADDTYREAGRFVPDELATSPLLPALAVSVDDLFAG